MAQRRRRRTPSTRNRANQPLNLRGWFTALLILVPLLLYLPTVGFSYVRADDVDLVVRNESFIGNLSNVPAAFSRSYFEVEGDLTDLKTYYRPMVIVSFMIDAQLGGVAPAIYHATNVLLHMATVLLLCALLRSMGASHPAAFAASLLFAVHPLNVQTVGWIAGRNDSLLAVFALLSLLGLDKYAKRTSAAALTLHLAAFALALFTKETGIILLPMFALIMWLWHGRPRFMVEHTGLPIGYALIGATWAFMRSRALSGASNEATLGDYIQTSVANLPQLLSYTGKVVFPVRLHIMPGIDLSASLLGVTAVCVLVALFWRVPRPRMALALGWFVLFLAPGLVVPDLPVYEHRAYVPLLGIMLGASQIPWLGGPVWRWTSPRLAFVCVISIFVVLGVRHSPTFSDGFTYWESATRNTPYAPIAHVNLGRMYEEIGDRARAITNYRQALEIDPETPKANNNLGVVMMANGEERRAREFFERELEVDPTNAEAHFNLGLHAKLAGRVDDAVPSWETTIELNPYFIPAYQQLADYYRDAGDLEKTQTYEAALTALETRMRPSTPES